MGRTPLKTLNRIVSSESFGTPEYQPETELLEPIKEKALTINGSAGAATTNRLPLGARASTKTDMAFESGAVAKMTRAPPKFRTCSTGSVAAESM